MCLLNQLPIPSTPGHDVDFGEGKGKALFVDLLDGEPELWDIFKVWLEDATQKKVWHNYSFDRHVLMMHDIDAQGFAGDTMHMARMWDSSRKTKGGYSLAALSETMLDNPKVSMKELFGVAKTRKDGTPSKIKDLPPIHLLQRSRQHRPDFVTYVPCKPSALMLPCNLSALQPSAWIPWPTSTKRNCCVACIHEHQPS